MSARAGTKRTTLSSSGSGVFNECPGGKSKACHYEGGVCTNCGKACPLSTTDFAKAWQLFCETDSNNNGLLDITEFGNLLRRCGMNPSLEEIAEATKALDVDNSGTLSFDEFIGFVIASQKEISPQEHLMLAFRAFDKNGDGKISAAEFREAMMTRGEPLSEAEVDVMMQLADTNKDGSIDYKEFLKLLE
ncbi:troponin C, skeletal muscle [Pelomyxa schiedti]|nr:troponin C, skeletal muscle [Pelomyxa schiedti]